MANPVTPYTKKILNLKRVPKDIYSELLKIQAEEKQRIMRVFSLESAAYILMERGMKKESEKTT